MARSDPQVNIRMPQVIKDKLEAASQVSGRSLNAEIITRIEGSFISDSKESNILGALEKIQRNYSDKERLLAEQSKATRMIFDLIVQNFESVIDMVEGNKKLSRAEIKKLKLDLMRAQEIRKMLGMSSSLEHLAEDEEDEDRHEQLTDDFEQEEPGLHIRNKP